MSPLTVRVLDRHNVAVAGASVSWQVTAGGGTLSASTTQTDAAGRASVAWTLGPGAGEQRVTAQTDGAGQAGFTAAALTAGSIASIEILQAPAHLEVNATHQMQAVVRDAPGTPITGRPITWVSSDSSVLHVTPAGLATARAPGSAIITAAIDGHAAGTGIRVHLEPFVSIAGGQAHTCALTAGGSAYCWGRNVGGELGNGSQVSTHVPTRIALPAALVSLNAGNGFTCGLDSAGAAWCWGVNTHGQLGNGSTNATLVPTRVASPVVFTMVSAGHAHACGLAADGVSWCWGRNLGGAVASLAVQSSAVPIRAHFDMPFTEIHAGADVTCGTVLINDWAFCWGAGEGGLSGNSFFVTRDLPTAPVGWPQLPFRQVSVTGGSVQCGIITTGATYCWGMNQTSQLGTEVYGSVSAQPRRIPGDLLFASVAASVANHPISHACGLTAAGETWCWGGNMHYQLGVPDGHVCLLDSGGHAPCTGNPLRVDTPHRFASITAGGSHTCALTAAGIAYCWGLNDFGQLGVRDAGSHLELRRVDGQVPGS